MLLRTYQSEPVGNCRYSDITVSEAHPVKIITTGEGGMNSLTNEKTLADRMARLRSHGITRDPKQMVREPHGSWYYEQLELGYQLPHDRHSCGVRFESTRSARGIRPPTE